MNLKAVIYPNFSKNNAFETTERACRRLNEIGVQIFADIALKDIFSVNDFVVFGKIGDITADCDVIITIGGDGTILEASAFASENNTLLLGINTGRLGFMASMETDDLDSLSKLLNGDYSVENRMMLDCIVYRKDGSTEKCTVLNDILISGYSLLVDYNIHADDMLISKIRSDGILFSTPTGSTAYSLSAGGSILDPMLSCIQMTPVCPQSLCTRPMIFSSDKHLVISHSNPDEKGPVYISADGQSYGVLDRNERIEIFCSSKTLRLIDINGNSFYNSVNNKLMHSVK